MIAIHGSDNLKEAVRNRTSLSTPTWTVNSIVVQPVGYLKGQPAQHLSNSLPFGGMLKAQPSWSADRSDPLWDCEALVSRRLRTKPVE